MRAPKSKGFTSKEIIILQYLLSGYTIRDIAERVISSYNAVRSHVRRINVKCGVKNQSALMEKANKLNILPGSIIDYNKLLIKTYAISDNKFQNKVNFKEKELDIMFFLFKGLKTKDIAEELNKHNSTIKNYLTEIYIKSDVVDDRQLFAKALSLRLNPNNIEEYDKLLKVRNSIDTLILPGI